MEKIKIKQTVICEGKYDKIKLSSLLDTQILTTDGFSVFNNKEKIQLFRRIAEKNGIIIITDSDGAGFLIRNKLKGMLNSKNVYNIYIPKIEGKEKRKSSRSAEGLLGVEGVDARTLRELFVKNGIVVSDADGCDEAAENTHTVMTKPQFYELGLSGRENSKFLRELVCEKYDLPKSLSANALLEALNLLNITVVAQDLISASEEK